MVMAVVKGKKNRRWTRYIDFFSRYNLIGKKVDIWNKSVKRKTLVHRINFLLYSAVSTPVHFRPFHGVFNAFIYGPVSSGKSVDTTEKSALKFTAKLPSLKVVIRLYRAKI